jgi:hypothetical protein
MRVFEELDRALVFLGLRTGLEGTKISGFAGLWVFLS